MSPQHGARDRAGGGQDRRGQENREEGRDPEVSQGPGPGGEEMGWPEAWQRPGRVGPALETREVWAGCRTLKVWAIPPPLTAS